LFSLQNIITPFYPGTPLIAISIVLVYYVLAKTTDTSTV